MGKKRANMRKRIRDWLKKQKERVEPKESKEDAPLPSFAAQKGLMENEQISKE